ncbi:PTS glucose transporter subunit IIBC, partial [Klebsiella pneumoniae]
VEPVNQPPFKFTVIPVIVSSDLMGITEPDEFLFIIPAPLLSLIYSLIDCFFLTLAWLLHISFCSASGLIDYVVYTLPAGVS